MKKSSLCVVQVRIELVVLMVVIVFLPPAADISGSRESLATRGDSGDLCLFVSVSLHVSLCFLLDENLTRSLIKTPEPPSPDPDVGMLRFLFLYFSRHRLHCFYISVRQDLNKLNVLRRTSVFLIIPLVHRVVRYK